ncbi:inorganic phosphate transporter [Neptuniibacter sp.]|uniref:inorganic phosphate transporter n=1 Tax=Neptuniibacter sp. TaxID=1962643 RepID=UPI002619B4B0|nr:inorganic phosphate transporter [Neptuniibacter sp.]MCP4598894.1 inorganic phosphate transporter [Neptuniibacter sp.]
MDLFWLYIVLATLMVLIFDFTNGFHDASNMVASVIASRAMTPRQSVLIVGTFTFLGPVLGGTAVANTIGKFVVLDDMPAQLSLSVVICGLFAATAWNLITWWRGLPSSSSHALVGGLAGAVVVSVGPEHVVWGFQQLAEGHITGVTKVLLALVLSPLAGLWVGFILQRLMLFLFRAASPLINRELRGAQWISTSALAFAHGANDAQKSMGILTLCLLLSGEIDSFEVPLWVMLTCAFAITLGTVLGGWRIVRTLAFAIYKIRPLHAFNSQASSGGVIFLASMIGAPVSTTHVVSSSIMGIGAAERPKAVRWAKAKEIALTWILTIPGAALVAVVSFAFLSIIGLA